ncbi:hypothetical protein TPHA_0J02570 [Tetrapisispora phaffii CBS 4417]|uniref:Selenoprotein O n=1 Tax=Tetrapisispora phaffii (strain ATCC 24235 / CBS 4417 / NBRC 1672 / NRRL Y-8282 / UCD 70-5) TaxID=1071381 RepID=G8BYY5_TETPH|nr:hypothetical protein TPHA_0J02570 [Tetrapisispora phaffii CBS 4417]CCE65077.1 hypothetical protein TPHA_0J02570 [Tetrapisispora phaffii CBS 4417]
MTEKRAILKALQESSSSSFIKKLTPDELIPNIKKAITLYETIKNPETDRVIKQKALKTFHTSRRVSNSHFSFNIPEKREHYKVTLINEKLIENDFHLEVNEELYRIFSGEDVYVNANQNIFPYSMTYAGYQFGSFAGQLGDGRVVNLFELKDINHKTQSFQLKGSGTTPYSRFGDGKAVIRSSIREFIISESLFSIGIPATRAVQLTILPGTKAQRDGFKYYTSAVTCRMSPSWIRVGNFDYFSWKPNMKNLLKLTDYCISHLFDNGSVFQKEINLNNFKKDFFKEKVSNMSSSKESSTNEHIATLEDESIYDQFFRHVVKLNAETVAYWQAYGFLNGVLNTDNTSIMGLSMDFGPFAVMDRFEPDYTPNHDDVTERYSFANQPTVIWWNLVQFAKSIAVLLGSGDKHIKSIQEMKDITELSKDMEEDIIKRANVLIPLVENEYTFRFTIKYAELMSLRLGVNLNLPTDLSTAVDIERAALITKEFCSAIVEPLLDILQVTKIDYNNFFVKLQEFNTPLISENFENSINKVNVDYLKIFFNDDSLARLATYFNGEKKLAQMAREDSGEIHKLLEIFEKIENWTLNYSKLIFSDRQLIASKYNPLFIPRSWVFDEVIDSIIEDQKNLLDNPEATLDLSLLYKLYNMSSNPYNKELWDHTLRPEKELEWTNMDIQGISDSKRYMKQCSCSS